jgi:single-strand DNA-binding protein
MSADTHVTVVGNLTGDPELKFSPNGVAVANFRVAVTPRVREGDQWKDGDTSFFRVNAWRDLAQNATDSLANVRLGHRFCRCRPAQRSRFQTTRVSPGPRWSRTLVEGGAGGRRAAGGLGEHSVAAGVLERVDLQVRLLVGDRDPGLTKEMARTDDRRRTVWRRCLCDVGWGHGLCTRAGRVLMGEGQRSQNRPLCDNAQPRCSLSSRGRRVFAGPML